MSTGHDAGPIARLSEEPYAGKPHVGICEGGGHRISGVPTLIGKKNQLAKANAIAHVTCMKTITATSARSDLYRIIDSAQSTHEPVQITGKRGNAVLVAEDDWRSIQETIYLLGIPGMRDSIIQGMAEDIDDCSEEVDL